MLIYIIYIMANVEDNENKAKPVIKFNVKCPSDKILLLGNRWKTCRTDQAMWLKRQSG